MSARHSWPGTRADLRLVHDSRDAVVRENRERAETVIYLDNKPWSRALRAVAAWIGRWA